jgi:hypothetical protein
MFNGDRTTKILLTLIAIFLGVLVFKSLFDSTPRAAAQQRALSAPTSTSSQGAVSNTNSQSNETDADGNILIKGYRTIPVSTININAKDKVLGLQVIDSAQAFLIQYSDRVEVYRVDTVILNKILNKLNQNNSTTGDTSN